jgi:hypothetical protein
MRLANPLCLFGFAAAAARDEAVGTHTYITLSGSVRLGRQSITPFALQGIGLAGWGRGVGMSDETASGG